MRLTVDTNILVRAFAEDDPNQSRLAQRTLRDADEIVLATTVLCEFVWVMTQTYHRPKTNVAATILSLTTAANIRLDQPAVEAGLAMMDAGGDFADGVIAYEGQRLGGEVFASFDQKAVRLLTAGGVRAQLLG